MKLLLIEDNLQLQTSLRRSLERRGMAVALCGDGRLALSAWRAQAPDLVLLDLSLPGLDGLQLLGTGARGRPAHARHHPDRARHGGRPHPGTEPGRRRLPAQALRPRRARGQGARAGAAHGSIRPEHRAGAGSPAALAGQARLLRPAGRWRERRRSTTAGQPLELPPRELALLRTLLSKPGHAIAKDRLFEQVFPGESEVQYDAIEVVVYRLRKKIAHTPTQIVTLRGLGYLIKAQP